MKNAIEMVKLKRIVRFHYGAALKSSDRNDTGKVAVYGSNGQVGQHTESIVDYPTIVIGRKGSVGSVHLAPDGGWPIDTTYYTEIIDDEEVHLRYLFYALKRAELDRQAITTSIPGLSRQSLYETKIPLPPLAEQKRIADILDKADAIRRKRQEAIQESARLSSVLFNDMFGDPTHNAKGWPVKELAEVCTQITDGVHAKPKYKTDGVPFVSVKDVTTGTLDLTNTKFVSQADHDSFSRRCRPELNDILYTKVGATYGRPAIVNTNTPFSLYVSVALLKPNRDLIEPLFLREVLATDALKRQADQSIKGAGVPDLHLVEIRSFAVPVPPRTVQKEFVKKTQEIHRMQDSLRDFNAKSNALFNSLVHRAFRGEL